MKAIAKRMHIIGVNPDGKRIWANTAPIMQRSMVCVGGMRDSANYTRRKNRRGKNVGKTVTAMMLVAVANEIARRRAKNKAAAQSRRINRR